MVSLARSRAVVTCSGAGRPLALANTVRVMPSRAAVAFILATNASCDPATASASMTATSLADFRISACSAVSTVISAPTGKPDLARGLAVGEFRAADLGFQRELALADRLEHQQRRHDLGERGRMPLMVLVLGVEHSAVGGIKQQRRARCRRRQSDGRSRHDRHQGPRQHHTPPLQVCQACPPPTRFMRRFCGPG